MSARSPRKRGRSVEVPAPEGLHKTPVQWAGCIGFVKCVSCRLGMVNGGSGYAKNSCIYRTWKNICEWSRTEGSRWAKRRRDTTFVLTKVSDRKPPAAVDLSRRTLPFIEILQPHRAWHISCNEEWLEGLMKAKLLAVMLRWRFALRRYTLFDWHRHRFAGLLCSASTARGRLRASALPRPWRHWIRGYWCPVGTRY
jgi:hypothetical protein